MKDFEGTEQMYSVYGKYPQTDGTVYRRLLGRFMIMNNNVSIVEDHIGMLENVLIPGPLIGHNERALRSLEQSAYSEVVGEDKIGRAHV
jgi:hypothetical protein